MRNRPRVAVSSCLLGQRVRYDGAEKRNPWVIETLSEQVEVIAICPEVGAGMPVPRPAIRVVRNSDELRLRVVGDGRDVTTAMNVFIKAQLSELNRTSIDGYLFKARSPSCGVRDTPYFSDALTTSTGVELGAGLWAAAIQKQFRDVPIADESEVTDLRSQTAFLKRIWTHFHNQNS